MSQLSDHDKAILNCVFNPNLPLLSETIQDQDISLVDEETSDNPRANEVKQLELDAIQLAENGELNKALHTINKAIEISPLKASLYNNRAHIYQFEKNFPEALNNLNKAIDLACDKEKKTLCQAHCQRGLLNRRMDQLELARKDFEIAANFGSSFAKNQLVELNPYAALCNQMLRKVMENL